MTKKGLAIVLPWKSLSLFSARLMYLRKSGSSAKQQETGAHWASWIPGTWRSSRVLPVLALDDSGYWKVWKLCVSARLSGYQKSLQLLSHFAWVWAPAVNGLTREFYIAELSFSCFLSNFVSGDLALRGCFHSVGALWVEPWPGIGQRPALHMDSDFSDCMVSEALCLKSLGHYFGQCMSRIRESWI